jgi:hypothetical protein
MPPERRAAESEIILGAVQKITLAFLVPQY